MKKLALILVFILIMGCAYAEPVKISHVNDANRINNANVFYKRVENGYALFDINNNRINDEVYASSFGYNAGMIRTYKMDSEGVNRRGIIREDGTEVIPFKYGDVQIFNENWVYGLTLVEAADRNNFDYEVTINDVANVYLIDTVDVYSLATGKVMSFTRENFSAIDCVSTRSVNIMDRSNGSVTTYDENFNVVGVQENGSVYSSEYAISDFNTFYDDGRYGAKDAYGNMIVEADYARIYYPRLGNYAVITRNDKEGLMDINGNVIIEPQFEGLEAMYCMPADDGYVYYCDGYVFFEQDDKMGYATAAGVTCEPKYSSSVLKNHGVSCSFTDMEGNYNILAADGIVTTVTGYKDVTAASHSKGYYYIVSDENYNEGLIDWHGNVIFPCEYDDIEFTGNGEYLLVSPESYGDIDIYTLNEVQAAAPAAEVPAEAPAAPASGLGSIAIPNVDFSAFTQAAQAPAAPVAEAPAAPAASAVSGNNAAAVTILQSAQALLAADPAANAAAVSTLIDSAIALLQ